MFFVAKYHVVFSQHHGDFMVWTARFYPKPGSAQGVVGKRVLTFAAFKYIKYQYLSLMCAGT